MTHFRCRKRLYRMAGLGAPGGAALFWFGWEFLQSGFWTDLRLSVFGGLPRGWMLPFWIFTVAGWALWWGVGLAMLALT